MIRPARLCPSTNISRRLKNKQIVASLPNPNLIFFQRNEDKSSKTVFITSTPGYVFKYIRTCLLDCVPAYIGTYNCKQWHALVVALENEEYKFKPPHVHWKLLNIQLICEYQNNAKLFSIVWKYLPSQTWFSSSLYTYKVGRNYVYAYCYLKLPM
jgi:hypothetical protein